MTPKTFVTLIAVLLIACSASVIAAYVARFGLGKIAPQGIRFVLACALSVSLIRGWSPGRWIAVVLMGLSSALAVILMLSSVNVAAAGQLGVEFIALTVIYGACAIGLLTPFAGRHFSGRASGELVSSPEPTRASMSIQSVESPRKKGEDWVEAGPGDE